MWQDYKKTYENFELSKRLRAVQAAEAAAKEENMQATQRAQEIKQNIKAVEDKKSLCMLFASFGLSYIACYQQQHQKNHAEFIKIL